MAPTQPKDLGPSAVQNASNARFVAAYLRVSTPGQAEDGLGLEIQNDAIRAHLLKHPELKLARVYRDEGHSGSTLQRPALQELLTDAKERRFGTVLVAKLDRLARDLFVELFIEKELLVSGVDVVSVSEAFNGTDPVMTAMRNVIGVFSQLERDRIRERMLAGRLKKLESGGYAGGRPPTGYVARGGKLIVDEDGAKIVRRIRKLRMARLSFEEIASRLNADGVKTLTGAKWYASGVHRIIRNPVYRGSIRYGQTRPGAHLRLR